MARLGWLAAVLAWGAPVFAHVAMRGGNLVDLVERSDIIAIGTTERARPQGAGPNDTMIRVERALIGIPPPSPFALHSRARFAPGRYVFFMRRHGGQIEPTPGAGASFPTTPADDGDYAGTIRALYRAVHAQPAQQVAAVRAALIPALSASAAALRYQATLALSALARDGHGPTDAERRTLVRLLSDPTTDPGLRAMLSLLVGAKTTKP